MKKMRRLSVAVAAGLTLALSACSFGGSDDIVISYNSPEQWANWGAVLDAFSDETGIDAPSDDKNSGKVMAALESEKGSPAGDTAYYGITFGMEAQEAGLVAPFEHERLADIPDTLKADDGSWFTVHHGAVAFLVNTEAIGDVAVPQCWEDLTKPEYRGLVSWLDPATAAVGQSVVTAANLALGGDFDNWQPAIDWANAVKGDGALQLPTETATNQLAQGEIPILIDADFNGYQIAQAQNAPIEVVLPCEGSLSMPYVMSLVKDAPHQENAEALLDFVLSDKAQTLFAESFIRPIFDVEVSDEVSAVMLPDEQYEELVELPDFAEMNAGIPNMIELWNAEVVV
ncbi:MAG TPA: extracellular solute-binding protein [Candidatus Stackebrandtia excrementipullorum]|nr:extracellular solute-binding protein [Candidatus Stackebrandtia excrementipullorum]